MSEGPKANHVSVQRYIDAERCAEARHEYVGGTVRAMAGASNAHNQIATNILVSLGSQLRGKPCRPFNSDTRIRLRMPGGLRFYYPDVSITCRPNPPTDAFQDEPKVVVEVISPETRSIDENEKRLAYTALPSLSVYLLVEQSDAWVRVYRRVGQHFESEEHRGVQAIVPLPEIGAWLALAEAYDGLLVRSGQ